MTSSEIARRPCRKMNVSRVSVSVAGLACDQVAMTRRNAQKQASGHMV